MLEISGESHNCVKYKLSVRKLLRKKNVKIKLFTPDDALRLSRQKGVDTSGLSRGSAKIVRESRFTTEQINRAFAEAKKLVLSSSGV